MDLTKNMKVSALYAWFFTALIAGAFMGYSIFSYKFQRDCVDKGYTNIGKGYQCNERFGETLK